ncbi:MAG: sugar phosphate nucleotidyltransferase [Candidatus Nanohaloarchaea archaeon]
MKAIVLAGGHATRLWPVTKNRAKPLLPLGDRPIIDFILEELGEEADETIISTNQKFKSDFEDYLEDYDRENVSVVAENQASESEKPGTIGAIINLLNSESLEDDLLVIGGDNYYSFSISSFLEFCREKDAPANVAFDVEDIEIAKQVGIVDLDGDRIVDFVEKPDEPPSTLGSIAVYYFPREDVELFHRYERFYREETDVPEDRFLDEPGRLIEWAHEQTPMYAYSFSGEWFDVGTPEGYLKASASVADGNSVEGETENCVIGENVVVMENARLENVTIENSIVFPETEITDSEVRNSIIDRDCVIENSDINDAVLGMHSRL